MSSRKRKRSGFADGASTSGLSGSSYEVFLSFRGPDTRRSFTDFLYESLVDAGIRVFRDDEELFDGKRIWPELELAIKESKIYIPIFSKNYASSPWCLQELERMVKLRKESEEREIVPIFFDVSPSDVRLKTDLYRKALLEHEGRYSKETVQEWGKALTEVADLKGYDARNAKMGKLIKDLVRELSIKLKKRQKVLPDQLVGIDDRVKDVMQSLNCSSQDRRFLVVHGMGGIGKTTLAKAVFNEISAQFDGCSFLSDIGGTSSRGGIVRLQKRLLDDILKRSRNVHDIDDDSVRDVDDGVNMIQERFRNKKVLIVLDDVENGGQLRELTGNNDWLGPGSRIIVTTRNVGLLPAEEMGQQDNVPFSPKFYAYEMKEMSPCHALQLFSKHAFGENLPPDDREALSSAIVATTGRIPLALEASGSFLRGKSLKIWEETLERLRKVPAKKVQEMLSISYEALSFQEKQMYLDIACFFVGEESTSVSYMWRDLGYYPESGLAALIDLSLLKIDHHNHNTLRMHDLIRDCGREIVREQNYPNPEGRSRLWEPEECLGVLSELTNYPQESRVESLRLQFPEVHTVTSQEFAALSKLRALHVEGVNFIGDYKNVFRELRWLSWDHCPADFNATNFSPRNLVVLKLSNSELGDDWPGWQQIMKSSKLKVLELEECRHLTRLPDLSSLSTLERLTIRNCQKLVDLGESIGKLVHLNYLEINACKRLRGLPEEVGCLKALKDLIVEGAILGPVGSYLPHSIGNLQSLTRLEMESVRISELPHSIGELKGLKSLCFSRCDELRELPHVIGGLESLLELDLSCTKVTELPVSIGSLSFLRILNLSHTHIQSVPTTINQLSHLQELHLKGCHELEQIPELPTSLIKLYVESCSLKTVPNLSNLTNLVDLIVSDCFEKSLSNPWDADSIQTPNLNWVGRLCGLRRLKLVHKDIIALPTELNSFPGLERLVLSCFDLQSLTQPLPPTLYMLKLINFNSLAELSPCSDLKNLSSLELCKSWLIEIPLSRFGQLENLTELTVSNCTFLVRLSCLSILKKLRVLHVLDCPKLVEIRGLDKLESLESIRIGQCSSLLWLPHLLKLKNLKTIEFMSCSQLGSLPQLPLVAFDCHLVIDGCDKLADHNGPFRLYKGNPNPRSRL